MLSLTMNTSKGLVEKAGLYDDTYSKILAKMIYSNVNSKLTPFHF